MRTGTEIAAIWPSAPAWAPAPVGDFTLDDEPRARVPGSNARPLALALAFLAGIVVTTAAFCHATGAAGFGWG